MAECPVCHADLGIEARRGEIDGFSYRTKSSWYRPDWYRPEEEDPLFWACPGCKSLLWKTGTGPAFLSILILLLLLIAVGVLRNYRRFFGAMPVSSTTEWMLFAACLVSLLIMMKCVNRMRFPLKPVPFMSTSRKRVP